MRMRKWVKQREKEGSEGGRDGRSELRREDMRRLKKTGERTRLEGKERKTCIKKDKKYKGW